MSKQEYDTRGYPVDRNNFATNLTWAFVGLGIIAVTAGVTLMAITLVHVIFR